MSSGDELDLLRASARGALEAGSAVEVMEALGQLGLLGLLVPEAAGGAGWCPVEATVVADEVGRSIGSCGAPAAGAAGSAPAWASAAIAAAALAGGTVGSWLASTLDGTRPVGAGVGRLRVEGDRASGVVTGVELGDQAPAIVALGPDGSAVAVDLAGPGVDRTPDPTAIDTTTQRWRVELRDAPAVPLPPQPAIGDAARLLVAATSVGSLRAAVERLTTYLADRDAFGAPIASFQAIQHRLVDLTLLEIRSGVAVDAAARALAVDPAGGRRLTSIAHAFVAERVPPSLDECIQLTGGIGFTWEYPLHHELRRSVADSVAFGSARASRERVLTESGWL